MAINPARRDIAARMLPVVWPTFKTDVSQEERIEQTVRVCVFLADALLDYLEKYPRTTDGFGNPATPSYPQNPEGDTIPFP